MRHITVGIQLSVVLATWVALTPPARGGSCDLGTDPVSGKELTGQEVTCGGDESTCIGVSFAERGDPFGAWLSSQCHTSDPLTFTDQNLDCYYEMLQLSNPALSSIIYLATLQQLFDLQHEIPRQSIAELSDVPRPEAFFEPIAELDLQTWVVEFSMPPSPVAQAVLGVDPSVDVKLRGWFIRGAGDEPDEERPLLVLAHGRGNDPFSQDELDPQLHLGNRALRTAAYTAAEDGFDVLIYSQRAAGISDGWSPQTREPAFDIFRALDQLEMGIPSLGAGETVPVTRTFLESAHRHPVVLVGFSQGAGAVQEAMSLDYAPTYEGLPNEPRGYDFRGAVLGVGMAGSPYYALSRALILSQATAISVFDSSWTTVPETGVLQNVDLWPGLLLIAATGDPYSALAGDVDMYNRARGFKEIRTFAGGHVSPVDSDHLPETLFRILEFAHRVTENDPPTDNAATTTVQRQVCKALDVPPMQVPGLY